MGPVFAWEARGEGRKGRLTKNVKAAAPTKERRAKTPRTTSRRSPSLSGPDQATATESTGLHFPFSLDPAVEAQIDQFSVLYPFPLDEFQREAIRTLIHDDSVMVAAPTGTGKALSVDTRVLTPTGWTAIGDLQLGDPVFGAEGRP